MTMSSEIVPCQHLNTAEFGYYTFRRGSTEQAGTLMKCSSCGKFLTLDSREIPSESVVGRTGVPKENMRSAVVQLNSDIYEKIETLSREEGGKDGEEYFSKLLNELLGLGLHHYTRERLEGRTLQVS